MINNLSIIRSLTALAISATTFWLTRVKKGILKMTRPTVIFFGPDGKAEKDNKVFIRTLLYSTSDKGHYIQNMFIRLTRGESIQNFNVWVYGDKEFVRGSGLYINKSGVACNHHFLLPKDGGGYSFLAGDYKLEVYVETVSDSAKKIFEENLYLKSEQQSEMLAKGAGVYFDWAPNTQNYFSHIAPNPKINNEHFILKS